MVSDAYLHPQKVSGKPGTELISYTPVGKPNKFSKENPVVITQFNVLIKNDQKINARTGGVQKESEDAQLILYYRLKNLDKSAFPKATDEMADYLQEKFKSAGYKTIP